MDPVDVSVQFVVDTVDEEPTRWRLGNRHSEAELAIQESICTSLEGASRFRISGNSRATEGQSEEPASSSLRATVLPGRDIGSSSGRGAVAAASDEGLRVRVRMESPVPGLFVNRTAEVPPSEFSQRGDTATAQGPAAIAEFIASLVVAVLHEAVPISGGVRVEDRDGVRSLSMDRGRVHGLESDDLVLIWIRDGEELPGPACCHCDPDDQTSTLNAVGWRETSSEQIRSNADAKEVIAVLTDMKRRTSADARRKAAREFSTASLGAAASMMAVSRRQDGRDEDRPALMAAGLLAAFPGALAGSQDGGADVAALPSAPSMELFGTVLRIEEDRSARPPIDRFPADFVTPRVGAPVAHELDRSPSKADGPSSGLCGDLLPSRRQWKLRQFEHRSRIVLTSRIRRTSSSNACRRFRDRGDAGSE